MCAHAAQYMKDGKEKRGLSLLADGWWRKKGWGRGFIVDAHTHINTDMDTIPPILRAQNTQRSASRCAIELLSVCLFTLYKRCSVLPLLLIPSPTHYSTLIPWKMVSLSSALKCNLTHDQNITRIMFSCYFHSSVTKVSILKKKRERKQRIEGGGDKQVQ